VRSQNSQAQRPQIIGIARVKNEQDIIEPFVRHNIQFLDRMIVVDNASVDETRHILGKLASEFENLVVNDDREFGHRQSEWMTRVLRECQADYVVLLDGDEFLDSANRESLLSQIERIPSMGCGLIPWRTFVLKPGGSQEDPPRTMVWRRQQERPVYFKAILRLDGESATDIVVVQGNHSVYSVSGRVIPTVRLEGPCLQHFPVRSRDQLVGKIVAGWMACLAKDPNARVNGECYQWLENYDSIAAGHEIDEQSLCLRSLLYAQEARSVDWSKDVVRDNPPSSYNRKYSNGRAMGATQLIVRSWEAALTSRRQSDERVDSQSISELIKAGRPGTAVDRLTVALARGETPLLWNDWATAQYHCGNADRSESGYRNALRLDPANRRAGVNLGLLLLSKGKVRESVSLLVQHKDDLTLQERQLINKLTPHANSASCSST